MLHWLDIDYRTLFRLGDGGRMEGENDPEGSGNGEGLQGAGLRSSRYRRLVALA